MRKYINKSNIDLIVKGKPFKKWEIIEVEFELRGEGVEEVKEEKEVKTTKKGK